MKENQAWAGRVPGCGCLVAAVSGKASPEYQAEAVADMIRGGLEVSQVDTDEVRLTMQLCTHEDGQLELVPADKASTDTEAVQG